ncbi:MAG: sigma-54 dependent transcriptional regulator [Lentisphaeria bacterium]|nr:sigma-54 dependent transcriptional regulator [Lentisphaeria bacterium]
MFKAKILIVEDNILVSMSIADMLQKEGFAVEQAEDGDRANIALKADEYDLVLLDMMLPDTNGSVLMKSWVKRYPYMKIVILTAHGDVNLAVDCLKDGASDFVSKPAEKQELIDVINKHIFKPIKEEEKIETSKKIKLAGTSRKDILEGVIGTSKEMKKTLTIARKVAQINYSCLLITGESGSGKGLFARALHKAGVRKDEAFVEINCSALPATLIESELFGHKKGAFTDAKEDKLGLFKVADKGTIFLDEIGDMELGLQAKLLKVLEDRAFRRIGDTKDIKVDVAIIAATHQPLNQLVKENKFRLDLFYRLNVIPLPLSPLRERQNDIPELTDFFIKNNIDKFGLNDLKIDAEARTKLLHHNWPGNVRELKNVIERASILCDNNKITSEDLMMDLQDTSIEDTNLGTEFNMPVMPLSVMEKKLIEVTLKTVRGNKNKTAEKLGIHRTTLYKKIQEYGLEDLY